MKSLAINGNNDIYVGGDGNIVTVTGLPAIVQNCKTAMQAQRGEMQYDVGRGMPTRATVYDTFNPAQFIAAGRATLLTVDGVTGVSKFEVAKVDGKLIYTATIETIYGTGIINV